MTLHHVVDGPADAPALVLAGSLGSTVEMWRPQLADLARTFRVVRIDHRGHGRSADPGEPSPHIADLADDCLAVLDELGLDRVAWCGLSLGGMVGMHLGSEHPSRLTSLTLCATTAHFADPQPWLDRIAGVEAGGMGSIAQAVVARWFTADWAGTHPDVVAECHAMVAGASDAGYAACCAAIVAWDHVDRLPAVAVPTLVIAGADDLATPVEPHARTLAAGIPGARLEVVPGGHLATIETAAQTTTLIAAHAV